MLALAGVLAAGGLSIKIILLAGLKPLSKESIMINLIKLSIKIILLAGLKQLQSLIKRWEFLVTVLSIKIILLAGLKLCVLPEARTVFLIFQLK